MLKDTNNEEDLKIIRKLFMDEKITEELGVRRYYFFKACLFSKENDCNMRYNPEIENSKCNNSYFKSIINNINNIEKLQSINDINDLKDHLLYLKQNGIVNIEAKEDSMKIIPNYNDKDLFIYPVKKRNYHLFHGTSIENAKSILKDGYIKGNKRFNFLPSYNKVFIGNSTKYASIYGMSGSSKDMDKVFEEDSKDFNEYSILFQINTSKYDVYHYCTFALDCAEYFIWDSISVKDIEKVYLMRYCEIVREIEFN